jgi:hypothetical protein
MRPTDAPGWMRTTRSLNELATAPQNKCHGNITLNRLLKATNKLTKHSPKVISSRIGQKARSLGQQPQGSRSW